MTELLFLLTSIYCGLFTIVAMFTLPTEKFGRIAGTTFAILFSLIIVIVLYAMFQEWRQP